MNRFRVGLLGVGWVVAAGASGRADDVWHPAGRPPLPARVIPAGGEPAPLPPTVRTGVPDPSGPEPIWLPATRTTPATPEPPVASPVREALRGPRVGAVPPAPQAESVPLPPARPLPPPQVTRDPAPRVSQEPPGSDAPPKTMPRPVPPGDTAPLGQPRPLPPPAVVPPAPELPPAPAELLVPAGAGAPGKHGTFGSQPIRLSRDYPTFAELHGGAGTAVEFPTLESFGRGYVRAEYLLWWMTGLDIPVLGTTNTSGQEGYLNQPGTVPVIGPGEFIGPTRSGFRGRAGWWFGDGPSCGIDGGFFFLGRKTAEATVTSAQYPTITRPIFAPNPGIDGEFGERVTVPGVLTGSLSAAADSVLWGFDANIRRCWVRTCDARLTWFVGYRNLNLKESLEVTENITVVGPGGTNVLFDDPIGTTVVVRDSFFTRNYFHGGQVGATYERRWNRVLLDVRTSVAFGVTHQELEIEGFQRRTRPGMAPMVFNNGGLLAASSNIGTFTRDLFSVVPELTINLGYQITPGLRAYVGYNLLYWPNVIRPGDQIDRVVDLTNVPNNTIPVPPSGLNRPQPLFKQSDLWVNGVQFGVEWRW